MTHLDQPALQGHLLGIELAEPLPFDPQPANGDGQTGHQGHAGSEAQKGKGATQGVERGETGMTLRLGKAPPASLFHQREKAQAASSKSRVAALRLGRNGLGRALPQGKPSIPMPHIGYWTVVQKSLLTFAH